jgi:hypothetical protein
MIATIIPLFQGINQLPIILDPIILDEGGGIEETLRRNNGVEILNLHLSFLFDKGNICSNQFEI